MPTITTVAFDRLLEPRASKSMTPMKKVLDSKVGMKNSSLNPKLDKGVPASYAKLDRGMSLPPLNPERSNGTSTTTDRKHLWAQPALYATPESTQLPDSPSPSSFPPSPYIINHKRRGPRLLKSFSQDDVATHQRALKEEKVAENADGRVIGSAKDDNFILDKVNDLNKDDHVKVTVPRSVHVEHVHCICDGESGSNEFHNETAGQNDSLKSVTFYLEEGSQADDFFDPQDSMSATSNTEGEANGGVERSVNITMPGSEFYDACEELSSESGPQLPLHDIEDELREMRLSLLMEIEKRKEAEEYLNNMRCQWLKIREQLSLVGLALPADPVTEMADEQSDDPMEELSRQVYIARFVSNCIGRGTAKAEVETEMESLIESKNFEIARLLDRLHYYEAVNREMSQRNQESVESGRRLRQRRKRRQRWVWGSVAAAVSLGAAALAWSYLPTGKGSSSSNESHATEGDHVSDS